MTIIRCLGIGCLGGFVLAGVACDRIKQAAKDVQQKAQQATGLAGGDHPVRAEGEADPGLQELVDFNQDGYRFRHDLPFPGHVRCRVKTETKFTRARLYSRNALGSGAATLDGTATEVLNLERDGGVLTVGVEQDRFTKSLIEGESQAGSNKDAAKEQANQTVGQNEGLAGKFLHRESGWKPGGGDHDFRVMAWTTSLAGELGGRLAEWGMVARSSWFGDKRLLPGAEVRLTGSQIAMITGTEVGRGEVTLRFERVTAIGGHPCGVFAWQGEFSERASDLSGEISSGDLSIDDGRVWCSLIHPVLLRRESKGTITSVIRQSNGQLKQRLQGAIEERVEWEWVAR